MWNIIIVYVNVVIGNAKKKCSKLRNITSIRVKKWTSALQLVNSECTEGFRTD